MKNVHAVLVLLPALLVANVSACEAQTLMGSRVSHERTGADSISETPEGPVAAE